ncbi:MAG: hypothetical protein AB7P23_06990 [Amphiplicatus sp.]
MAVDRRQAARSKKARTPSRLAASLLGAAIFAVIAAAGVRLAFLDAPARAAHGSAARTCGFVSFF